MRAQTISKTVVYILPLALGLGACFPSVPITPAGQQVRLMKGDPPAACEELKSVEGSDSGFTPSGANQDQAKARLRNAAGRLGGNYVRMETVEKRENTVTVHGTAYRCPETGTASAPAKLGVSFGRSRAGDRRAETRRKSGRRGRYRGPQLKQARGYPGPMAEDCLGRGRPAGTKHRARIPIRARSLATTPPSNKPHQRLPSARSRGCLAACFSWAPPLRRRPPERPPQAASPPPSLVPSPAPAPAQIGCERPSMRT
jgi:hypothetical protein